MIKNYVIIDIGTGNSRVALVNNNGDIIDIETSENAYYMDEAYEDAQYFSPTYWRKYILEMIKKIIKRNASVCIAGFTSSGARESIVLINKEGKDYYGLPNIDNRGRAWLGEIKEKKRIYELTGRWASEDFPAAKLLGLRKKRKDVYDEAYTFTSLSEWIGYVLCEELCIEPSQACETQFYDIQRKAWSEELLSYYGITHLQMPEIKLGGTLLGYLSDTMKTFLEIDYDIPFIVGGADTQVAMMGANIKDGDIGIVSGTTSPIVAITSKLYLDKEERCWSDCFIGNALYQIETNPGVTGLNYQRIRKLLFDNVSYEDLEAALQEVKTIKCTASFSSLDFEHGKGYHHGGFFMKPPFRADLHRIDMAWAVVADIACSIYYQYQQLLSMVPNNREYILGCGGGFQSKMLCQHISDLCQKQLKLPNGYSQSSILGCIKLCNQFFNLEINIDSDQYIIYKPKSDTLIHEYYTLWNKNRKKVNE